MVNFLSGNKLEEDAGIGIQQQPLLLLAILESDEALRSRIGLHTGDAPADQLFQLAAVWLEIDAAIDEYRIVGKELEDGLLTAALQQALVVHLHPGRDATDEAHILLQRFVHDALQLFLPLLDAVDGVAGQLVGAKPGRHLVVDDTGEPPGGDTAHLLQLGAARKEDHLTIQKAALAGLGVVVEQGVAGGIEVVGHTVLRQRDVLYAGGST